MTFSPTHAPSRAGFSLGALIGPVILPNRFALTDGMNIVRIMAGLFYAPHVYQKLTGIEGSLVFFAKAGLTPAPLFLGLALVFESLSFLGLTFGLFTRWIGLLSFGCMGDCSGRLAQGTRARTVTRTVRNGRISFRPAPVPEAGPAAG
ncbi:MAG: hypothetical protein B7Z15_03655 [Rhizobiales bacterium 32-66-8]|nr:MAG: hypothetical protein B7Z15_03655 [Rhizobiales bacterium 32-66-8]